MSFDYYKTLGVSESAVAAEIKKAYRKLARKLHPDVNQDAGSADRMVLINEAYGVLSDNDKRQEYDVRRKSGFIEAPPPPTASGEVRVTHLLSIVDLPSPIYAISFSPNGKEIALGCFDNTLRFLSPMDGAPIAETALQGGVISTLLYCDLGCVIAAGVSEKSVAFWKIENHNVVESKGKRSEWASQIGISPNGSKIAIGGVDRTVSLLDRKSGKEVWSKRTHDASITCAVFLPDGKLLATGSNDQKVIVYETSHGVEYGRFEGMGEAPNYLAFSLDGSLMAAALVDRSVRIYETGSGMPRKAFWGHEAPIEAVAFHPTGWMFASTCRRGETRLWNALGGKCIANLGGHTAPTKAVAFSSDGSMMAIGGLDRCVSIWKVEVGEG